MMMPGMMIWMVLLGSAALAVVVVLGVLIARRWTDYDARTSTDASGRRGLGVLEERFARGEIDREEFEDRRDALLAEQEPTSQRVTYWGGKR